MLLLERLASSESKRHDLLSWATSNFEEAVKVESIEDDSVELQNIIAIHDQLNFFVRYLTDAEEANELDSHFIFLRLSQLYLICLNTMENEHPEKIFDSAELLAKVLCEEDVSVDDELEGNDKEKKKKKKKKAVAKKTYIFSPAKDLACVLLTHIFEVFGKQLSPLTPLLFGVLFKNLKKSLEKSKYMHATYICSLAKLINAILRSGNVTDFNNNYFSKFSKISKNTFEALNADEQDFPVDFISTIIEIWSIHFKQESFIKDHINNLPAIIFTKFSEGELGSYGFTNDSTRPKTAKSLAEVLFDYFYVKNILNLETIWILYVKIFNHSTTRDIQSGCFESMIHFIGLTSTTDSTFLDRCKYLDIFRTLAQGIFDDSNMRSKSMDVPYKLFYYFDHMHKILLPRIGDSSKTQMLFQIMGSKNDDKNEYSVDDHLESVVNAKLESQWFNLAQLRLACNLISDLSSSFGNEDHHIKQIKTKLIELSTCEIFTIRIHANEVLKVFLTSFPEFLTETIEGSLAALTKDFNLSEKFPFSRNHGHALIIANLIDSADKDYVSYELIMRTTVFATSFIKNHTTSTGSTLYYKGIICWILLIGLVNYKDEQYLMMQSSQIFLFWKVLLTHSFGYRDEDDLYKNLEIRNHALTCLLTYIGNATMDKESAKQISYLLIKCSNFNHSISLKSNSIDKALLINEHRILQIYLRLHEFIKNDFNSSLLILIVKNFSDPNLYVETSHSVLETLINVADKKSSFKDSNKDEAPYESTVDTVLHLDDGFAFGISSKVSLSEIEELSIKVPHKQDREISGNWPSKKYYWSNLFENEIAKPITCVLSLDYLIMLYGSGHYTAKNQYSPRITTSLIDSSMEIFSLVFPYLNNKIQYSVIESLNLSMFSKLTSPLRSVSVAANVCVAIDSALTIIHENNLSLDPSVGQLLIDSLKKIEFYNDSYLMKLKADCIGLTCAAVNRHEGNIKKNQFVSVQTNILIKNVVDKDDSYLRILYALSLAAIYKYNSQTAPFGSIFEVVFALIQDPHPVVHTWSLKAMHILFEKHLSIDRSTAHQLIGTLETVLLDPSFGQYGSSILRFNYNCDLNSHVVIGQIVKTLTETLGPNIMELESNSLESYRNITIACLSSKDIISQNLSLSIYEMLVTFKLKGIVGDAAFIKTARSIVGESIVTGFGSTSNNCRFTGSTEILSEDSSLLASLDCFSLFTQLLRLQKVNLITKEIEISCWRYFDLHPFSSSIVTYLFSWLEQTCEINERWFDQLYLFFNMNKNKLFKALYKEFELVLLSEGYKKLEEKEIRGEEEKSITKVDDNDAELMHDSVSDSIHWGAKKITLELIKYLCLKSQNSKRLFVFLSKKLPELIRISFQASVSRVDTMKLLGLDILRILLRQYSKIRDADNPENSILELEEAQITSALMPAFNAGSPPNVIISAIDVCAEFLSSNIAPLERANRVSGMMVSFLEVYNDKSSEIKIGDAKIITQKAKRKTELAILNAWSKLVQNALVLKADTLIEFTKKYWDVLVPLWIISLREYVMVKYENVETEEKIEEHSKASFYESRSTKLELYHSVWLNFAIALGSILETDVNHISSCLNEQEADSFIFILFTQCIEEISKHMDEHEIKLKVLPALHNILKCHISLDNLFEDEVNEEIVGILDRLMLMGNNKERYELLNIINDLIMGYTEINETHEKFLAGIDKLYELLRLVIIPISELLPFVRYNSFEEGKIDKEEFSEQDLHLLSRAFAVFETNVSKFDDVFKVDLYACALYMMGRIYEDGDCDVIVPLILPMLKPITKNLCLGEYGSMMSVFYEASKDAIFEKISDGNKLATILILLTSGFSDFACNDLEKIIDILVGAVCHPEINAIALHGLKNIASQTFENDCCAYVFRQVLNRAREFIKKDTSEEVLKSIIEIVMIFTKITVKVTDKRSIYAYALCLSLLTFINERSPICQRMVTNNIIELIELNAETFKEAVRELISEAQKTQIESLLETAPRYGIIKASNGSEQLPLKSFE